jgi:glutamine amidotransferase-like uncharacterized protein
VLSKVSFITVKLVPRQSSSMLKSRPLQMGPQTFKSYYNGGGTFVDAEKYSDRGVEVLANYAEPLDVEGGSAAVVYCKIGSGGAIMTGPHPE